MSLPRWIFVLGFLGLVPFLAGPVWHAFSADSVPPWLDRAWLLYVAAVAAFMAGTFWGFALPAAAGFAGALGLLISLALLVCAWMAMLLPFRAALYALVAVFLLSLLADFWRERTLDTIPGYFLLRTLLTVGVLLAISWRLMLTVA